MTDGHSFGWKGRPEAVQVSQANQPVNIDVHVDITRAVSCLQRGCGPFKVFVGEPANITIFFRLQVTHTQQ
jgi:hypothetical protein